MTGVRVRTSKASGSSLAQQRRGVEAVDETGLAAVDRVGQAVQQLHRGHRVPVGVVGVRGDGQAGEGEVVRGRLDANVEQLAVVGLADVAECGCDLQHGAGRDRNATQQRESGALHGVQAVGPVCGVREETGPVALGRLGRRPQLLGVLAPVVRCLLRGEERRVEPADVAVAERDRRPGDLGDGEVGVEVGDAEELLPVAGIAALGARAVVAQPDGRLRHGWSVGGSRSGSSESSDQGVAVDGVVHGEGDFLAEVAVLGPLQGDAVGVGAQPQLAQERRTRADGQQASVLRSSRRRRSACGRRSRTAHPARADDR